MFRCSGECDWLCETRRIYIDHWHGTLIPLFSQPQLGMGLAAQVFYRRLAALISEEQQQSYGMTMGWIRCCLSFSLLPSQRSHAYEAPDHPITAHPVPPNWYDHKGRQGVWVVINNSSWQAWNLCCLFTVAVYWMHSLTHTSVQMFSWSYPILF